MNEHNCAAGMAATIRAMVPSMHSMLDRSRALELAESLRRGWSYSSHPVSWVVNALPGKYDEPGFEIVIVYDDEYLTWTGRVPVHVRGMSDAVVNPSGVHYHVIAQPLKALESWDSVPEWAQSEFVQLVSLLVG